MCDAHYLVVVIPILGNSGEFYSRIYHFKDIILNN